MQTGRAGAWLGSVLLLCYILVLQRTNKNATTISNTVPGIIKYIGRVDFEEGVWLGVELRTAKGRHDGTVRGRRYFTCRPRHGIMVRPNKVYVRGINGAKLVKPEEEDDEEDYP